MTLGQPLKKNERTTYAFEVQLVLSTDGLRLLWTPEPGAANIEGSGTEPSGFVRTTDIRNVTYIGADPLTKAFPDEEARPMYTRFAITTPFETINFAIEDLSKLQHFVCGLRHLANLHDLANTPSAVAFEGCRQWLTTLTDSIAQASR